MSGASTALGKNDPPVVGTVDLHDITIPMWRNSDRI